MLVFWQKKLVVFSIPKTGTSAFEKSLAPHADMVLGNPPHLKHLPVYRFNRFLDPMFDVMGAKDFEKFALIREPLDWLGSWYKYRSRSEIDGQANSCKDRSFDEFVLEAMKGKPEPFGNVGRQAKFLGGGVGPAGVDHLFQYEQINLAKDFLEDRLGHKFDLKPVNVSPKRAFTLSQNVEKRYRRKMEEDFLMWENAKR